MGYISTTVDVDIDFDDISDDDILDVLDDRIKKYKRKIKNGLDIPHHRVILMG